MENGCSTNKHKDRNFFRCVHLKMSCPLAQLSAAGCKPSIKFSFLNRSTGTRNAKSKPQVYLETTNTT